LARKKKSIQNLLITGIADKGKAVGRTEDGQVIFVERAVPGDVVDVLVIRKKKSMSEAVVTKFVSYSDQRIAAPCAHFGVCGGCKWQNLGYEAQLTHKFQTVKDCIRRIAKLDPDLISPIIGCVDNLHYRNKLEYSFSDRRWITTEEATTDEHITQLGAVGFHRPGSFDKIVDIEKCHLQDDLTNRIRNHVRTLAHEHKLSFYNIRAHHGFLRNMIVRNTTLGDWMVIMIFGEDDQDGIHLVLNDLQKYFPEITSLFYVVNTKVNDTIYDQTTHLVAGNPYILEKLGDVTYKVGPKSFFQTNPLQAKTLFDVAKDFAELQPDDTVYDLYTGLGSIALYIAQSVKNVVGIEEVEAAITDAKANMEFNNITNATFYAGDVKDILNPKFIKKHGHPRVVITDPPRIGMHPDVVETLLTLEAERIVYISCNPATQARDLLLLSAKYDTTKVQPVDMFPHTHHIESVAQLTLKKSN